MRRKIHFCLFLGVLFAVLLSFVGPKTWAAVPGADEEVSLVKGDLQTLKVYGLERISITNTGIADIVSMTEDEILLIGQSPGRTTLFVWDRYGKRNVIVNVTEQNLSEVKDRLQKLLAKAEVKNVKMDIDKEEGKIITTGELSQGDKEKFERMSDPFSRNLMNLIKTKEDNDLIQIDTQILEFTGSYSKSMGMDWTSALTYSETLPSGNIDKVADIFRLGDFRRTTQILTTFNALITEGKGRVLSRPKLVVTSGKTANFLVGGEIPITETTTSSGGNVQQDVSFKDYGVGLNVTPTIKNENEIELKIELEVSDVDAGNSVAGQPAFSTRSAQTELYLGDGQTVIIAGLMKQTRGTTVTKVPFLGDIPIAGALFRKKVTPANETDTELAITLTPTILRKQKIEDRGEARTILVPEMKSSPDDKITADVPKLMPSGKITTGAISTTSFIPEDLLPYMRAIQERIAQRIVYPSEARDYGWSGTVKLSLRIDRDGTLNMATVSESSGYDLFDQEALRLVRELSPYSGFPVESGLNELNVTIPIVYSMDAVY